MLQARQLLESNIAAFAAKMATKADSVEQHLILTGSRQQQMK
jgi:DNA-binding FadR family transcriptional regulator